MGCEKDSEQDEMIRQNAERIARNEAAIARQTEALEKIRDHYYPRKTAWKSCLKILAKVSCGLFAYLGIAETVDWLWNARESDALAEKYGAAARRLFVDEGDAAGAVRCYERAVETDPKESEYAMALTFMKGMAMASELLGAERSLTDDEQARVDTALAEATVLKELDPDNPMPYVLMAQAFLLGGERDDAVDAVERAVACAPENASVRVSACAMQFFTGHLAEARAHLAEAERLDATLALVVSWKGVFSLMVDHDVAAARECFRSLVKKMPRFLLAYQFLGKSLLAGKDADIKGAREAFRRVLVLDAKFVAAMLGMVETYEREGNLIVARLWCDRALEIDPKAVKALLARAKIHAKLGEWREAVQDWECAIDQNPFCADYYRERANALEKCGLTGEAAADRKIAEALEKSDEHTGN